MNIFLILIVVNVQASDKVPPFKNKWAFSGPLGRFDRAAVVRGAHVFKSVCAACHGVNKIAFRNLMDVGLTEEFVKDIASDFTIRDGPDDDGEMFDRPGVLSDYWPSPFLNEKQAQAANNGVAPPDLSLIIKGRECGADYVYALLTGYIDVPPGLAIAEGNYYNPYAENYSIAMAPPLSEGIIDYDNGREATVENMAYDIVNFLQWAAEPEMEERKLMGLKVMIFLFCMVAALLVAKCRIWSKLKA